MPFSQSGILNLSHWFLRNRVSSMSKIRCLIHFIPMNVKAPSSSKVRHNSVYKPLQGLRIQKPEHKMGHTHFMKLLQFADHFCAVSGHEVLLRMAHNLTWLLRDTCCTQIGQFDVRRISAYSRAVVFQNGNLASILTNRAGIEIPPVRMASHYCKRFLFTTTANEQRNGGIRLWFTIGITNAVMLPYERCRARGPHGFHDDSSLF